MRATMLLATPLLLTLATGCGESHETAPDGGNVDAAVFDAAVSDAAVSDAAVRTDAGGGDAGEGCPADLFAAVGTACAEEGATCSSGCEDACSFCNILMCSGGRWDTLEVFPAPCFACGDALQCQEERQYCHVTLDDTGGPDLYRCLDTPDSCEGAATCACLEGDSAFHGCDESVPGQVRVTHGGA